MNLADTILKTALDVNKLIVQAQKPIEKVAAHE